MMKTDQCGSTLLLVTWLLAIMALVATFLIYRSEAEWAMVLSVEENAKARQIAEQVLYDHLAIWLADEKEHDIPAEDWFNETGRFEPDPEAYEGFQVTVLLEDEGSKPNINMMNVFGLQQMIPLDDREKNPVDPLLDWIDPDSEVREKGAESDYYKTLTPPYKPRDGFLSSLQEVLAVKDGQKLAKYFGQELSVYGKINPNTLNKETFRLFLELAGVQFNIDKILDEYGKFKYERKGRFNTIKDVDNLKEVFVGTADKLKPFFDISSDEERLTGACNINLISEMGLKVVLRNAGMIPKSSMVNNIMEKRREEPFKDLNELSSLLGFTGGEGPKFNVEDYFTLDTSIVRYRIWVSKGSQKYYLNTVQKRIPGDLRQKWKVVSMSWQALNNKNVPAIPKESPFEATLKKKSAEDKEKEQKIDDKEDPSIPGKSGNNSPPADGETPQSSGNEKVPTP